MVVSTEFDHVKWVQLSTITTETQQGERERIHVVRSKMPMCPYDGFAMCVPHYWPLSLIDVWGAPPPRPDGTRDLRRRVPEGYYEGPDPPSEC